MKMKRPQDKTKSTITELVEENLEGQRISLSIDKTVLRVLREERMDINQLFIMLGMYNEYIGLLDYYDNDSQNKRILVLDYQDLQIHGYLEEGENTLFRITEKGKAFVEKIKPLLEQEETEKENTEAFKKLCQDYLLLFPKIKLPSGKYARVSVVEIEKKLRTFVKTYKPSFKKEGIILTDELILKATTAYVTRYVKDGYRFMVTSSYFIQKNEKSALADEILAMGQGLDAKPKTNIVTM